MEKIEHHLKAAEARPLERHRSAADERHGVVAGLNPGRTLYADGRFYLCLDRMALDADGMDDIFLLARIQIAETAAVTAPLLCCGASLHALERAGRAALMAADGPRPAPSTSLPSSPRPTAPMGDAVQIAAA